MHNSRIDFFMVSFTSFLIITVSVPFFFPALPLFVLVLSSFLCRLSSLLPLLPSYLCLSHLVYLPVFLFLFTTSVSVRLSRWPWYCLLSLLGCLYPNISLCQSFFLYCLLWFEFSSLCLCRLHFSPYLCPRLFISLALSPCLCLRISLSLSLSPWLCLLVLISAYSYIFLLFSVSLCRSPCFCLLVSVPLSLSPCLCLFLFLCFCVSVFLFLCLLFRCLYLPVSVSVWGLAGALIVYSPIKASDVFTSGPNNENL
jgi:hypothetical protein